jgi:effector-binding domain-containing protein
MDMDNLSVEMGFALNREAPGTDTIKAGFIPAGKKAVTLYKGAYRDMAPVYEAMSKWISESGHKPTGVVYEHYYNSPDEVPESELLTKIVFLLE